MKKTLIILLSLFIVAAAFAACSNASVDSKTGNPKNVSTTNQWLATTITTDTAKIKESDAINYIKGYSAKELSLTKEEMKEVSILVTGTGVEVEGDYYIEVDAVIKNENGKDENGNTVYTFDIKGKYFIRYDGKRVLKKDMTTDTNKYIDMDVHDFSKGEETTE